MLKIIELAAITLLTMFTFYYIYFITRVRLGLFALQRATPKDNPPKISVIVAARNEELTIGDCLESLLRQTYSADKFEIIVVDDGSTDKTAEKISSFSKRFPNVRLISTNSNKAKNTGGKPAAIAHGVENADGEIILTTDADCIAPPRWIEIMVNYFDYEVAFVAGPVAEQSSNSFFSKLEQLELLGLITTAAGLIGSGRPIICNGANAAYKKCAFIAANGFGNNDYYNDDELLMNRIVVRKIGKVVFASESDAVIITKSSNGVMSFFKQRIRWANKRGHYEDKSILVSLISLYLFFFSIVFVAILIKQNIQLILPFSLAFTGKIFVDYMTLRCGAKLFKQPIAMFHFLIAEILHAPYIVIAAAIGQISSLSWKGRKIT